MKKLTKYQRAVEWIALNDEPTIMDQDEIQNQISVMVVAHAFQNDLASTHPTAERREQHALWLVALDVYQYRRNNL